MRWQDDPDPRDLRIARMFKDWDNRNESLQRLLDYPHSALAERALELEVNEKVQLADIARLRGEVNELALENLRLRGQGAGDPEGDRWELRHVLNLLIVLAFGGGALWLFVLEMVRAGS